MLDPRIEELPPKIRVLLWLYAIKKRDGKIVLEHDGHTHRAILKVINAFKHTHGIHIRSQKHQKNANRHAYQLKNPLFLKVSTN